MDSIPRMPRYQQARRIAARVIEGAAFVVSVDLQQMFELNEVGTFIWDTLSTPASLDEIAASVSDEFDVPPDQARRDTEAFLGSLLERSVVELERTGP